MILNPGLILPLEDLICKKRGSTKTLPTVEENKQMILYIVEKMLGLSEEEFRALYSTAFNSQFLLSKYITQMLNVSKEEAKLGKQNKDYVFGILYQKAEPIDVRKEIARLLNADDDTTKRRLAKMGDIRERDKLLNDYLDWLFCEIMNMTEEKERFLFLSKAEELKFAEKITCFACIYKDYYCLLDFYYFNMSLETQKAYFEDYLTYRVKVPEGMDVIKYALRDKKEASAFLESLL